MSRKKHKKQNRAKTGNDKIEQGGQLHTYISLSFTTFLHLSDLISPFCHTHTAWTTWRREEAVGALLPWVRDMWHHVLQQLRHSAHQWTHCLYMSVVHFSLSRKPSIQAWVPLQQTFYTEKRRKVNYYLDFHRQGQWGEDVNTRQTEWNDRDGGKKMLKSNRKIKS